MGARLLRCDLKLKFIRTTAILAGLSLIGVAVAQVVGTAPTAFWQKRSDCPAGSLLFTTSGTFTVPTGCTSATFYAWGGGGGGGKGNLEGKGGGGGYSTVAVTGLLDGQTYSIQIGQGGKGGACGTNSGGTGGFNGGAGSTATGSAGTVGGGAGAGGAAGTKVQNASNGGAGKYGGGGGGAAGDGSGNVYNGAGGGGATTVIRNSDSSTILIAGGGGGGGAEYAGDSGEKAGSGGPGCAVAGTNGTWSSGASEGMAGGGGGGACVGDSTSNGSGNTPGNSTDAYGAGLGAIATATSCSLSTGANGKVIVDYGTNAGADITPYGIFWDDFTSLSQDQPIFGIATSVNLEISSVYDVGTPTTKYRKNGGAWVTVTPGTPLTVSFSNRDMLQFEVTSATDGDKATFTVRNLSDSSRLIDTVQGTSKTCSGNTVGGYCWYMSATFDNCDNTCTPHGGYNAATRTYTGDTGTNAQCDAVLLALGSADVDGTSADSGCSAATGCMFVSSGGNTRCTNLPTTSSASEVNFGTRACACKY